MTPSPADVRRALERVLRSQAFASSKQQQQFLRYVVEEQLAGRGGRIKGYSVALEVYGKDPHFDAQTDPYVRVEAGRLRKRLADYYASEGGDDLLQIALPKGSYAPVFERTVPTPQALPAPSGGRTLRLWPSALAASLLLIAATGVVYLKPGGAAVAGAPPTIWIEPVNVVGDESLGRALNDELAYRLSQLPSVWGPLEVFAGGETSPQPSGAGADYMLESTMTLGGHTLHATSQLVDAATRRVVWSEAYTSLETLDPPGVAEQFAIDIANTLRDPFGPLAQAEIARLAGQPLESRNAYQCLIVFLEAMETLSAERRDSARACLERPELEPALGATELGALALLHHLDYLDGRDFGGRNRPALELADETAARALSLDGRNVLALIATAAISLDQRKLVTARDAVDRAIALEPPPSALGMLGTLLVKLGEGEQGIALFNAAVNANAPPTPALYLGPTLHYLGQQELERALTYLDAIDAPDFTMLQVIGAATALGIGQPERAQHFIQNLETTHPELTGTGTEILRRWSLPPDIEIMLTDGLRAAGIDLT